MPKKKDKKNGDKQDKDKKMPKKDSSATAAEETGPGDKEKALYLTQIRYMSEQLEGYQLKCDQLQRQKQELTSQCTILEKEKKDIVAYLKRSLLEKEDEVDELTQQLESQRQAADEDRDALELQRSQLRGELQDRIEELTTENATLATRLSGLEEFQKQKEQLMSNMASLEKQLASLKEEQEAEIHNLNMKALLERQRLEEEMESHMAAMTAEVKHLVDQKVPQTTRMALQENMEVKAQFSQLSEQAQILMGENSALRDRKSQLSVDVDILEQMLSETTRQSCVRKKLAEQLTEKCQQLKAELKDRRQEFEQLQTEHTGVQAEMEALRQGQAAQSEQCSTNRAQLSRLEAELQEERRKRSRMKSIIEDTAVTVRQALVERPTEQDSVVQWKQLMTKLLLVLKQPRITNFPTDNKQQTELQTSDPAAATGAGASNPAQGFQLDLGLVPPLKHKQILSRTGAGSSSTLLPLHRKPSALKTTGSIHSTDSAIRFLTSKNSFTKLK